MSDRPINELAAVFAEQAANRPPRDVVPRRPVGRIPTGPQTVTHAEVAVDVDGIPAGVAAHTETAWVAKPVTWETIKQGATK